MNLKRIFILYVIIFMIIMVSHLFSQKVGDIVIDPIVGTMRLVPVTAGTDGTDIPRQIPRLGEERKDYENNPPLPFTPTQAKNMWVMETEVSQQMWNDLMLQQPSLPAINFGFQGPANPVENVTWYDAVLFANLLSLQNGLTRCYYSDAGFTVPIDAYNYTVGVVYCNFNANGYRLPTESEWQYMARAGDMASLSMNGPTADPGNYYTCNPGDLPTLEDMAWYCVNSDGSAHPVGSRLPNALNLLDLQGNVSEWCWDWWGNVYPAQLHANYTGPLSGVSRVVRGGSWNDPPAMLDPDNRYAVSPDLYFDTIGFRLLKPLSGFAITSPQGGEYWKQGTTHSITWTHGDLTGDVTIELYKGGVFDSTISSTVPAIDETFSWDIPTDQATGDDYKIKINQDTTEAFSADNFTIYDAADYLVSFTAGTNGAISGITPQVVTSGGNCSEVTAVPNSCCRFVNWTGTGGFTTTTDNPLTVTNVQSDMTITANFEKIPYTVTFTHGAGGTVDGNTSQPVDCGGDCTAVTAVPDSCYRFVNWTMNGNPYSTDIQLTVSDVQSTMTLTANFEKIQYTVSFTAGANGTLIGTTPQVVDCGSNCAAVAAVPNGCYRFVNWTLNGNPYSTDNPLSVNNVQSNLALTANFEKLQYTVTFIAGANGTLSGTTPQVVDCGSNCTAVTAIPNTCYRFVNWTLNGNPYSTDNPLTITNVQSTMTLTANFEKIQYTVTFVAGANGTLSGTTPQVVDCGSNCTAVTAVPNSCYRFVNWSLNGNPYSTDNPLNVTNVQSDMTLTANFEKIQYTVTFVAGANGTLTGTTPQLVDCGSNCTAVAAVPNSCYRFVNWTLNGNSYSTNNPLTVTNVQSTMTLTANFEKIQYTVTFVAGANGTLIGTTPQVVDCGGNCTAVAAVPNSCYRFVNWTLNGNPYSTDNPLSITNVQSTMTLTANFEKIQYTVTFVAGANGTLSGTTPQVVDCGSSCAVMMAIPAPCYRFVNWTLNGNFFSSDNPLTICNIQSDMTLTANFEKIQYTVTFVAGANGTLIGTTPQAVDCGSNCTQVTAVPDSCFRFVNWTLNGNPYSTDNPLNVTNVQSDMTLTANFEKIQYTVTFVAGLNGTLTGTTPQVVDCGGNCTQVTAIPDSCFRFVNWTMNGNPYSTNIQLTVTDIQADMSLTANFEKIQYTVTFVAGPNGTLTGTTPQVVDCGGNCTQVTAVPDSCFRFVNWTMNGNPYSTDIQLTVTDVQADMTITAHFEKIPYTVTFEAGTGGSVEGDTSQPVDCGGNCTAVTAVPNSCYRFVNWTGTGGFTTTTDNPLTVTNVQSNMTVTANFEKIQYTVTFVAGPNGTLTGTTPQVVDCGGNCTQVTAVPDSCYRFVNWILDGNPYSTDNSLNVTDVQSDMTITAHFEKISYTVTFEAGTGGTVDGDTSQPVECGGNCTVVAAIESTGYHFVNWTGTGGFVTTTENPLTVTNVTASMTITANFAINTYTVNFQVDTGGASNGRDGGTITGVTTQVINHGGNCTEVIAVAGSGYAFVNWTGPNSFVSTNTHLTVTTVTKDMAFTAHFSTNTLTVTFQPGTGGTVNGDLDQDVNYGGDCTPVTAAPNANYHFVNWTGTNGFTSTENPLIVRNVTANMIITANFSNTHTVIFKAKPGGTLSGTTVQTVNYGGDCSTVTAVPNTGYSFVNWTGSDGFVSTDNPLTITNVTADMEIFANFTINTYTVTFLCSSGGTIDGALSQIVKHGENCTSVMAISDANYHFVNWTGTGGFVSNNNPLIVGNVTGNMTITANFSNVYTVTFAAGTGGTLTGTLIQTVLYGGNCTTVTAFPNTGYNFDKWTDQGGNTLSTNSSITLNNVTSDMTVTANFAIKTYTVTFLAGANGKLNDDLLQIQLTVPYGESCIQVTAKPNTGYSFNNWTGTGGFITTTGNPLTVANVTSDMTITANFTVSKFKVIFVVEPDNMNTGRYGGTINGITTQVINYGGSCSQVTAVPGAKYHWVNWTGTGGFVTTSTNPLTVTNVKSDMVITAHFSINPCTVTFQAGTGGTLNGFTTQIIDYGGTGTAVTAVPNTGYIFVNWTGTGEFSSVDNPLIIKDVTKNMTITANFKKGIPTGS